MHIELLTVCCGCCCY